MSGVVLESSSANARFPRHDQLVDRGFGLRAYLFSGKIIIPGDIARMETSESSFDLRSGFQVICRRNPASTEQNEPDAGGWLGFGNSIPRYVFPLLKTWWALLGAPKTSRDWKKDCGKPGCPNDHRGQVRARRQRDDRTRAATSAFGTKRT